MITIIYSTHKDKLYNENFKKEILLSVGLKNVQILEFQNNNEFSLSEIYNKGIEESIYDIVVCIHNDIKIQKNWGRKILKEFENNDDYGIIGLAGSCYFPESGVYWEKMHQTMVGQVYHHPSGQNKWINKYSPKLPFLIPVVTIDGLFISFDKTKIKHTFDESIGRFHFYDHLFCLPNYLDGVKIGVTSSFEITHESIGRPNQEFYESKEKFLTKWRSKLPLDLKPSTIYVPEVKEKPIKNIGKVAVIIPTKSNIDLLLPCVDSFYEHCNSDLFDIFIADTGSSDEEKNQIKTHFLDKSNIKLIEYQAEQIFYRFAVCDITARFLITLQTSQMTYSISNDICKGHLGGYPLGDINDLTTARYFSCLLQKMSGLNEFLFLSKEANLEIRFIERLKKLAQNQNIQIKYRDAIEIKANKIIYEDPFANHLTNFWIGYRPCLNIPDSSVPPTHLLVADKIKKIVVSKFDQFASF
jgi:hypothetical protein